VQSHQNKDTSPISWQFLKIDVWHYSTR
jgi:hypothetical protein